MAASYIKDANIFHPNTPSSYALFKAIMMYLQVNTMAEQRLLT
jgi:hypothetical protein